ncbi:MAG: ATP-binding protein [Planctomycetota bacterium]
MHHPLSHSPRRSHAVETPANCWDGLAQEIHDRVHPKLFVAVMRLGELRLNMHPTGRAGDGSCDCETCRTLLEVETYIQRAGQALHECMNPTSVIGDRASDNAKPVPGFRLVHGLRDVVDHMQSGQRAISLETRGKIGAAPLELHHHLIDSTAELIHNALRHGSARQVRVRLDGRPAPFAFEQRCGFRLSVIDDGIGFDASTTARRGLGLTGIRHRSQKHGGSFHLRRRRRCRGVAAAICIPPAAAR